MRLRLRTFILPLLSLIAIFVAGTNTALAQANLPPPSLISPPNGGGNQLTVPTLIWSTVNGALSYRVMVATSPNDLPRNAEEGNCSACLINDTTSPTFYIPSITLNPGATYYWQVKARNATQFGEWSAIFSFTTASVAPPPNLPPPSLISPPNGGSNQLTTPTLIWNAVNGASSYRVMMATSQSALPRNVDADSCSGCLINDTTSATFYIPSVPLNSGTTYYWQVKARNASQFGEWSAIFSFTTASVAPPPNLPPPSLTSPPNGGGNQSITSTLIWNAVGGATSYRVMMALNQSSLPRNPDADSCPGCYLSDTTSNTFYIPPSILSMGTTYYWQVKARNASQFGEWSAIFSFTTTATAPPPDIIGVIPNPVPGSNSLQPISFIGSNFVSGAMVTLRTGTQTFLIPPERTTVISINEVQVLANVTAVAATWTAQVTNPGGATSNIFTFMVTAPSICSLTCNAAAPTSGTVNTSISFVATATASSCSGSPAYDWDFGDGSGHSSQQNPTHIYGAAGTYTWTLTVSVNGASSCVKHGSVNVSSACIAPSISSHPADQTINSGQSVSLSVIANGTTPLTYQWYQGTSGNTSTPVPGATFSNHSIPSLTADMKFWVRVSNTCGVVDSNTANITVRVSLAPVASFTFTPRAPQAGQPIQFMDNSTGSPLSWAWDFNDDGIVDEASPSPTHAFNLPGQYRVALQVSNASGSDRTIQTVNVAPNDANTSAPTIEGVTRQYSGIFLHGGGINNNFTVRVNWHGSPGTVSFSINGGATITVNGTASGASHTFNIDNDFPSRFSASTVTIIATNGAGKTSTLTNESVFVFPFPEWLSLSSLHGPIRIEAGNGQVIYRMSFNFPEPPLAQNGPLNIPSFIPYIGGKFGIEKTFGQIAGSVSSLGRGDLTLSGQTGFTAMGSTINGRAFGSGEFRLGSPDGLALTGASFGIGLSGDIKKTVGIVDAIPALRELESIPFIRDILSWFNQHATLEGSISPSLDFTARFGQRGGRLAFDSGTGALGLHMRGALKGSIFGNHLTANGWVAGSGSFIVGVPDPLMRQMEINFQAGVELKIDYFFTSASFRKVFNASCSWAGGPNVSCHTDSSAASSFSPSFADRQLFTISRNYKAFGDYSVLQRQPATNLQKLGNVSAAQQTSLITNVFPGAAPALIEVKGRQILLWVHQDVSKPVLQSTNIYWTIENNGNWSSPKAISTDNQAELSPLVGIDQNGRVIATWMRSKDPAFSTPIDSTADLPLFYKKMEVVSAVFDPATGNWGPVTQLTDDSALDTNLHLASDSSGNLLLTWLSNDDGKFMSTDASKSTLKYSVWNGDGWTPVGVIASGLAGVNNHAAAINGRKAFVIVQRDLAPNAINDGVLDLYTWDGFSWNSASGYAGGGVENRAPSAVYDTSGQGHVVWLRGDNLVHATLSNPTPETIRTGSSSMAFYGARLITNRQGNMTLIWEESTDNAPANVFAMFYDPSSRSWSKDRRLSQDDALAYDASGYYGADGQIHLVYLTTEIERITEPVSVGGSTKMITDIPKEGRTDIQLLERPLVIDLAVSDKDLFISPQIPDPGELITVNVTVHNNGDFIVDNFVVNLYSGDPDTGGVLAGTQTVFGPFLAGEQRALIFQITYPIGGGDIVAVIDPGNIIPETNRGNNKATIYLTNRPPDVKIIASKTSGATPMTVELDASATVDKEGDAMRFIWAFADGTPNASGSKVSHTFNVAGVYPVTAVVTDTHGATGIATVNITVDAGSNLPVITGASISKKKLSVTGINFDRGAVILVDEQRQKTLNDEQNPTTILIAKKAGKKIASGQTVKLQVRNSDGTLSNSFSFARP